MGQFAVDRQEVPQHQISQQNDTVSEQHAAGQAQQSLQEEKHIWANGVGLCRHLLQPRQDDGQGRHARLLAPHEPNRGNVEDEQPERVMEHDQPCGPRAPGGRRYPPCDRVGADEKRCTSPSASSASPPCGPAMVGRIRQRGSLNNHCSLHVRMQGTKIVIAPCHCKRPAICIPGVKRR